MSKGKVTAAVLAALLTALGVREGVRYIPYFDGSSDALTVCMGITGPAVIAGKTYTPEECSALEQATATKFLSAVYECAGVPLSDQEAVAYGSLSYNIGTAAFCRSTIVRYLKAGDHVRACSHITDWHYVAGKDCRDPASNCRGIVRRRQDEYAQCIDGVNSGQ